MRLYIIFDVGYHYIMIGAWFKDFPGLKGCITVKRCIFLNSLFYCLYPLSHYIYITGDLCVIILWKLQYSCLQITLYRYRFCVGSLRVLCLPPTVKRHAKLREISCSRLPLGVNVSVNCCFSLWVSPVMDWRLGQGAPRRSPAVKCKQLQMINEWSKILWYLNLFRSPKPRTACWWTERFIIVSCKSKLCVCVLCIYQTFKRIYSIYSLENFED